MAVLLGIAFGFVAWFFLRYHRRLDA